jgi:AcrR family transcriptional regulator
MSCHCQEHLSTGQFGGTVRARRRAEGDDVSEAAASATPARPYHHGDLPTALLEAVDGLVRDEGLEAVSLRAVARRAGVSHAAPAHHFTDKSGLLAAFAQQGFAAFADRLEEASAGPGTRAERLQAMGRAYLTFARDHRPWFEVMFRPELTPGHGDAVHDAGDRAFAALLDHVTSCLDEGASPDEAMTLTLAAWSTVHGFAHLVTDGPLEQLGLQADAAEPVLAMLIAGMRSHPHWVGDRP